MKTWQGRIDAPANVFFEAFTSSVLQDQALAPYDLWASRAHALGLAQAGVISQEDAVRLVDALEEIGGELEREEFEWRDELEDVHTHVESRLREKIGPLADTLHSGRSRNDQVATDLRLYVKDTTLDLMDSVVILQESLVTLAERYAGNVMPGYTHLQQAQPVSIAQPLLAYVAMLGRDWERLRDALRRTDLSPLGAGALAGSTFPLDRAFVAHQLGFAGVSDNSIDAVSDRDFVLEFVSVAAICMTHLSRLAEDIIHWASTEVGFLRLPDAFASGSSMMPQKKNPDVPELIRGRTALVLGDLTSIMALVKGLPLAYNRDLQEDKTPLFHAAGTLQTCVQIMAVMVPELEFDTTRTEGAISSFALATDLADGLVTAGVPFRQAHGIVAGLVSTCLRDGRELTSLTLTELQAASPAFTAVPDLTPAASVRRKRTFGSTHPEQVARQIADWKELLAGRLEEMSGEPVTEGQAATGGEE